MEIHLKRQLSLSWKKFDSTFSICVNDAKIVMYAVDYAKPIKSENTGKAHKDLPLADDDG